MTPGWKILSCNVTGAGSNLAAYPLPKATFTGGVMTREPLLDFIMTTTQGPLSLNPGGRVLIDQHTPANASAAGTANTIAFDANYIYVCTGTNTWKRAELLSW